MSSRIDPAPSTAQLLAGDALLVIDVQNDFLPGGSLAVPHGERVLPIVNRQIEEFSRSGLPIVATRDWHPLNHCSFIAHGGPWPPHCIQGTPGAEFSPEMWLPAETHVASKGTAPDCEQYSAFAEQDLANWLRLRGVRRLFVVGVATEYCVLADVTDAIRQGFAVVVLTEAIAAIDEHDGEAALREMQRLGAELRGGDLSGELPG